MKNTTMIKETDKAYFRRLNRNMVADEIASLFRKKCQTENLSQTKLAEMLGMDRGRLSRILREPSNLQLDTISDLLLAMDSAFRFSVVPQDESQTIDEFVRAFKAFAADDKSSFQSNVVRLVDDSGSELVEGQSTNRTNLYNWKGPGENNVAIATN